MKEQDKVKQDILNTEVAIVYRKSDGHIARVFTLSSYLSGKITEKDIKKFFPNIENLDAFKMVLVKGRQYLEIDRYRVETDAEGNFIDVVEKVDVLTPFSEDTVQINPGLLDREVDIVMSVLSVIDDPVRLLKYKELEEKGANRLELVNFFKNRGI
jgi:hypothetical protein